MFTAGGRIEDKSPLRLPNNPGGNTVAKDGHFQHRQGKLSKQQREANVIVAHSSGTMHTRKGESIKPNRGSMMGLRDKMACASKGAKLHKFVHVNKSVDSTIDTEAQVYTVSRNTNHGRGGRSGGLARSIRG